MPLILTVDAHQGADLPPDSQLHVFFNDGGGAAFSLAGQFVRQIGELFAPPSDRVILTVAAKIGAATPITLRVQGIQFNNAAMNFNVFPKGVDKKFYIAGNIAHPRTEGNDCNITCLADGKTPPPGGCIDCQNDVAIVKLCCP